MPESLKITKYSSVKATSVEWLWYPCIAYGKITLLQGDPGNGKSTLALLISSLLSKGENTPNIEGLNIISPTTIIYQNGEDGTSDTIAPRLRNLKANLNNILFIENDDVRQYLEKISNADILVFATPIYYYGMTGQLKTFLDRLNPLYIKNNKFKEVYLLATCADDSKLAIDKTVVALSGWIECFDGVVLKDNLLATSTTGPNTITEEFKNKAYSLGESI